MGDFIIYLGATALAVGFVWTLIKLCTPSGSDNEKVYVHQPKRSDSSTPAQKSEAKNTLNSEQSSVLPHATTRQCNPAAIEYGNWLNNLKAKYGIPSVNINTWPNDQSRTFLVFEQAEVVFIANQPVKFDEILDSHIEDDAKVVPGKTTATVKSNVWNEITRDSMISSFGKTTGTLLAGPAKQSIEYTQTPDKVNHMYSVVVALKRISNSTLVMKVGSNGQDAIKINNTLRAIREIMNERKMYGSRDQVSDQNSEQ